MKEGVMRCSHRTAGWRLAAAIGIAAMLAGESLASVPLISAAP